MGKMKANSTIEHLQHGTTLMKPSENRIAPARLVRIQQQQNAAFRYEKDRWVGLAPRIANAYARFEDKSKSAIRERSLM
jgi:hypothetical protein